jgi:hypothetical protein
MRKDSSKRIYGAPGICKAKIEPFHVHTVFYFSNFTKFVILMSISQMAHELPVEFLTTKLPVFSIFYYVQEGRDP